MANYLDKNGIVYLWGKIKAKFVAKESGKGLSTNDYTTTEKNKLAGIASNANNYSLPTASSTILGGVKVGANLSISSGVLSAKDTTYGVMKGATASALPTSGQTTGDVYNIVASSSYGPAGCNVAWNGSDWDSLGGIFTITSISNSELDTICV